jgi:hypothetical protein
MAGNPAPRLAPGYVHAVHPDHGEPVVYTPGQLLPDWVAEAIEGGAQLVADEAEGSFTLQLPRGSKGGKR